MNTLSCAVLRKFEGKPLQRDIFKVKLRHFFLEQMLLREKGRGIDVEGSTSAKREERGRREEENGRKDAAHGVGEKAKYDKKCIFIAEKSIQK